MSGNLYIDQREDGKFRVLREGEALPTALSDTQPAAVALAREMRPGAIFVRRTNDTASGGPWRQIML